MNKSQKAKKVFERSGFIKYLRHKNIPESALDQDDEPNSRPDFILRHAGQKIYVEHTLLINRNGTKNNITNASLKQLLEEIKLLYDETYSNSFVNVLIEFEHDIDIKNEKKSGLIKKLITIVAEHKPLQYEGVILNNRQLPHKVKKVSILNIHEEKNSVWKLDKIRLYGPIKRDEFEDSVTKKNDDAISTIKEQNFNDAWLFLHTGEVHASYADFTIPDSWLNSNWVFSRIILYDSFDAEFMEIYLK